MLIDVRLNDDVSGKSAILTVGASSRALHLATLPGSDAPQQQ